MSDKIVKNISVTICHQNYKFAMIAPKQSAQSNYKVYADSHYNIELEFESGEKIEKQIGYVTNGMDFKHEIVITNSDINVLLVNK